MKASRKGTRLNDVQYFRQPLPHTRKKMTTMFLLPRLSDLQVNHIFLSESVINDSILKNQTSTKDRRKVDGKQSSVEMALLPCNSDYSISRGKYFKDTYQEISMETESNSGKVSELKEPIEVLENLSEENPVLTRLETERNSPRKLMRAADVKDKTDKRFHDKNRTLDEKVKHPRWWKDNHLRQTILQFFTKMLGKRETKITKQFVLNATINRNLKNDENRRKRRNRNNTMHLNGVVHVESKNNITGSEDLCKEDESREDVSMLVRQIQRTRDKNLRVNLLKQELRARLPMKNTLCKEICDESLASRQLSSPLC